LRNKASKLADLGAIDAAAVEVVVRPSLLGLQVEGTGT
jgi:hypothetical protein